MVDEKVKEIISKQLGVNSAEVTPDRHLLLRISVRTLWILLNL